MAQTIEGGAYKVGEQWVDADGRPLSEEKIAQAEALTAEKQEAAQLEEQQRQMYAQRGLQAAFGTLAQNLAPVAAQPAQPAEARGGGGDAASLTKSSVTVAGLEARAADVPKARK